MKLLALRLVFINSNAISFHYADIINSNADSIEEVFAGNRPAQGRTRAREGDSTEWYLDDIEQPVILVRAKKFLTNGNFCFCRLWRWK